MFVVGDSFSYGSLRSLRLSDSEGMLEWMRDPDVAGVFQANFSSMDEGRACDFIRSSWSDEESFHFAISGEGGEYMGTISLKCVDCKNSRAEYAISTRSCAHGTGLAAKATNDVLSFAFTELELNCVYLNVRASNARAIRFYEKSGFVREGVARQSLRIGDVFEDLIWFSMLKREFDQIR